MVVSPERMRTHPKIIANQSGTKEPTEVSVITALSDTGHSVPRKKCELELVKNFQGGAL